MKATTRLTVISFLLFMSRGMTGPLSSVMWRSLGASYLVIGLLGTVGSLTAIVASPLWGKASDRLGQRRGFLVGGLGLLAVATAAVAVIPGFVWLYPIAIATSLAQAAYSTASLALMGDWFEHEALKEKEAGGQVVAGRRMGTFRGLSSLGFGLMAFISGSIADRLSLQMPYLISAFLLAIAFVLALRVGEPEADPQSEDETVDADGAVSAREGSEAPDVGSGLPLAPLMVSSLLWSLSFGAVYSVWGNFMTEEIGYSATQMTRLWALASLSEFPLMIFAGWLSDRLGRLPMLAVGFVAWGLVFTGYLVAPTMPWIVLVQLTRGFAFSAHTATSMTYAAEVRKRSERGRISGFYGTAGGVGSILGSSVGGAAAEYVGFQSLIGSIGAMMFVGAAYLGGATVRHRRRLKTRASGAANTAVGPR